MTTPTDFSKMLQIAYPGSQWTLRDIYNFDTLSWNDTNPAPQPSLSDVMAQLELVKDAEALQLLRKKRNTILAESDIHALPDYPHPNQATKQAWIDYRQALRDLTLHSTPTLTATLELDDSSVLWPSSPND